MTTAADPIFIDTNVLVFASIPAAPMHLPAIAALHHVAQAGAASWISRQVIREFLVQLTRPGVLPYASAANLAVKQASALMTLYWVADEGPQVTIELFGLLQAGLATGKQVHDANIVATCLAYGIPRLLTHNVSDFQRYSSLIGIETL